MLIVNGEVVILRYKRLRVLDFVSHLNAYKIIERDEMVCITQDQLQDCHPFSLCKGFGPFAQNIFVVLRYRVDCVISFKLLGETIKHCFCSISVQV